MGSEPVPSAIPLIPIPLYRTGIAEAMGSNPVEALTFFRLF